MQQFTKDENLHTVHTPTNKCDPLAATVVCHQKEEAYSPLSHLFLDLFRTNNFSAIFHLYKRQMLFLAVFQKFLLPILVLH